MFDSIFESIFIFIPVAIIIGRFILQARAKHKKPPPRRPDPIHFEENADRKKPKVKTNVKKKPRPVPSLFSDRLSSSFPEDKAKAKVSVPKVKAAIKMPEPVKNEPVIMAEPHVEEGFFQKLNKLSPIKQAVIMAEVLGPPKALQ